MIEYTSICVLSCIFHLSHFLVLSAYENIQLVHHTTSAYDISHIGLGTWFFWYVPLERKQRVDFLGTKQRFVNSFHQRVKRGMRHHSLVPKIPKLNIISLDKNLSFTNYLSIFSASKLFLCIVLGYISLGNLRLHSYFRILPFPENYYHPSWRIHSRFVSTCESFCAKDISSIGAAGCNEGSKIEVIAAAHNTAGLPRY